MSIFVNVVNQKMHASSIMGDIVAGSQRFVKFRFNLSEEWDGLVTFAQFMQSGVAYNQYLDSENAAYLPAEIGAGTCTLMLYGSRDTTIGTTNYLTLKINENILVSDASSTDISESLYNQLVAKVDTAVLQVEGKANQSQVDEIERKLTALANTGVNSDVIDTVVKKELDAYIASGALANLTLKDGSVTKDKLANDVAEALDEHDENIAKLMDAVPEGSVILRYRGQVPSYTYVELATDVRDGDVFFCTEENCFYMWDGSEWKMFGGNNDSGSGEDNNEVSSLPTKKTVGEFITAGNVYTAPLAGLVLFGKTERVEGFQELTSTVDMAGEIKTIVLGENLCTAEGLNAAVKHATFSTPTLSPITLAVKTSSGDSQINYKLEYTDGERFDASLMEATNANGVWVLKTITPAKPVVSVTLYNVSGGSHTSRTADGLFIGFGDYNDCSFVTTVQDGLHGIPVTDATLANYIDDNGQMWCCDTVDYGQGKYVRRIGIIRNYVDERITDEYLSSTGELSKGATVCYILPEPVETEVSATEMAKYKEIHITAPAATIFNDRSAPMEVEYYVPLYTAVYDAILEELKNNPPADWMSPTRITDVTLLASEWAGEDSLYSQVVSISDITENSLVDLTPSVEQLAIFYNKDLTFVTENVGGVVTVYAIGQKPVNDYTIQVAITEVNV